MVYPKGLDKTSANILSLFKYSILKGRYDRISSVRVS